VILLTTAPEVQPPPLECECAKHTNLTGGAPACCGGYPPRTRVELADAIDVFQSFGFEVVSAGWDDDNDRPERTFRS